MKSRILNIGILLLGALLLITTESKTGYAGEFPSRPLSIIIASGPGGTLDMAIRLMGDQLSKSGVQTIMDLKGGGSGALAAEYVAAAKPDGYTILGASNPVFSIRPFLNPGLHYKLADFIPLCKYASSAIVIVVRKDSPFKTIEDLISYAKKNPGKLTCAVAGTGSTVHFSIELIKIQTGIDISYISYTSGGEMNTALMGGHVDFASHSLPPALGLLKSGDFRALVTCTAKRLPDFPNVRTIAEVGYPGAVLTTSMGYFLPKGTPKQVVDRLALLFEQTIKSPDLEKRLQQDGHMVDYENGPDYTKSLNEEYKTLEQVAKKAKLIK